MPTTERPAINTREFAPIIGKEVADMISGVKGRVVAVTLTDSGAESVMIQQARTDADGYPSKGVWLDWYVLENSGALPRAKRHELLGQEVLDNVTGYEGTITAVTFLYDNQCKFHIQSRNLTDKGIPAQAFICDSHHVERNPGGMKSGRTESNRERQVA